MSFGFLNSELFYWLLTCSSSCSFSRLSLQLLNSSLVEAASFRASRSFPSSSEVFASSSALDDTCNKKMWNMNFTSLCMLLVKKTQNTKEANSHFNRLKLVLKFLHSGGFVLERKAQSYYQTEHIMIIIVHGEFL